MPTRKSTLNLIRLVVTIAGLWIALAQFELGEVGRVLGGLDWQWLLAIFALMNLSLVIRAGRWWVLLRGLGAGLPFGRLVALYFAGNFFNTFLPSGIGGDVIRAVEAARDIPRTLAAGSVLADRLIGLMALFAIALCALPFRPEDFPPIQATLVGVIAALGLLGGLLLLHGSVVRILDRWLPEKYALTGDNPLGRLVLAVQGAGREALLVAFGISLVFNALLVGWWALAGHALGYEAGFAHYVLNVPLLSLAILAPSIGGLGVREVVAQSLFLAAGLTRAEATTLSLLEYTLWRLAGLAGAPLYLLAQLRRTRGASNS